MPPKKKPKRIPITFRVDEGRMRRIHADIARHATESGLPRLSTSSYLEHVVDQYLRGREQTA